MCGGCRAYHALSTDMMCLCLPLWVMLEFCAEGLAIMDQMVRQCDGHGVEAISDCYVIVFPPSFSLRVVFAFFGSSVVICLTSTSSVYACPGTCVLLSLRASQCSATLCNSSSLLRHGLRVLRGQQGTRPRMTVGLRRRVLIGPKGCVNNHH